LLRGGYSLRKVVSPRMTNPDGTCEHSTYDVKQVAGLAPWIPMAAQQPSECLAKTGRQKPVETWHPYDQGIVPRYCYAIPWPPSRRSTFTSISPNADSWRWTVIANT